MTACFACVAAAVTLSSCDILNSGDERWVIGDVIPGTERELKTCQQCVGGARPRISPDGSTIVYAERGPGLSGTFLYLHDMGTGSRHPLVQGTTPSWAPDGRQIAFEIGGQIYTVSVHGDSLRQLTFEGRNVAPVWHPNGPFIVFIRTGSLEAEPPGVWIMDVNCGTKRYVTVGGRPTWHPSGDFIVSNVPSGNGWDRLYVYDLERSRVISMLDGVPRATNRYANYSPDGSHVLFQNQYGIWIMDREGRALRRLVPSGNDYRMLAKNASWHPDGRHIVYEHFEITRYMGGDIGPWYDGVATLRLLNVEQALGSHK